jgi:heavy metal sensor kinase
MTMNHSMRLLNPGKSLRSRMALYYTGATAILTAMVFALIYWLVSNAVYRHLDEDMLEEAREIVERIERKNIDFSDPEKLYDIERGERRHEDSEDDPVFLQFVDNRSRISVRSGNLAGKSLAFVRGKSRSISFNTMLDQSEIRQTQVPVFNRDGNIAGYILLAVPIRNAMLVLKDLQIVLLVSFPGIIVSLFILTSIIAGKSIRPIEEIIATAEKITQQNLDERIRMPLRRDELYRLAATINELLGRLQDAFCREKQFTADASHELKTPLASVKGTLEVLVRKPREAAHYESRIRFAIEELNRMAMLVEQLLFLARFDSDSLCPLISKIDIAEHIDALMTRMLLFASEKNINMRFASAGPVIAAADPAMLDVILGNILSNAIKYSPEGSAVDISLEVQTDSVVCLVRDYGYGIPDEKMPYVFERFYRVDESRSSRTGGSGLGLSIVSKLAALQDIAVGLESRPDEGTTVTLRIPAESLASRARCVSKDQFYFRPGV